MNPNLSNSRLRRLMLILGVFVVSAIALTSCSTLTTNQYEATARTTYTWQVSYSINPTSGISPRFETFASTSLINRNGQKPAGAVKGPDEKGLWWPLLPPRPTVDEVEQRKRSPEQASTPELLKSENYHITYQVGNNQKTLPTNYQVYRQIVKAYPSRTPLQLTLGINNNSVEKAEPIN